MKKVDRKYFSIFDVAVILVVIAVAVISLLSQINTDDTQLYCVVRYNGEGVYSVALDSIDKPYEKEINGDLPVLVVIEPDGAYVKSSSCPDKLCEHTGKITKASQSCVCLPAQVSVTLESINNALDAVVG